MIGIGGTTIELLLGSGWNLDRQVWASRNPEETTSPPWKGLVTLDWNPRVKPGVVADLGARHLPFRDATFEEIHAYEVLEHVGQQGDWKFFFSQFDEFGRILKPGGHLYIKSPGTNNPWVWGDPGHTRYMGPQVYYFLDKANYEKNQGKTPMTDYRSHFQISWKTVVQLENEKVFMIILRREHERATRN